VLIGSLLLEWVLGVVLVLLSVVALVVFLVASEHFRVLRQVLLIRSPFLVPVAVTGFLHVYIEFDLAGVVVVDSVLDVLEVLVRRGHTHLAEHILELVLHVLQMILVKLITVVELLSEILTGVFLVDLRHLLHFQLVLGHQVLLLLS